MNDTTTELFRSVVSNIGEIGKNWHSHSILEHAEQNKVHIAKGWSIKNLPALSSEKTQQGIVISAGPSLHKFDLLQRIKASNFKGALICVDGSYIKCLKAGIVPDFMLSLDPHPTRMVRWFGDHDFEKNAEKDDYFNRQDLDVAFRNNSIIENRNNIELINRMAPQTKLILCSTAPANVVARAQEAGFPTYWWNPLVDHPQEPDSLTKKLFSLNPIPCMNTGGTVGTAAWVFAHTKCHIQKLAVVGMDLGYHSDTPYSMTQTYYELQSYLQQPGTKIEDIFPQFSFPLNGQQFYTDPTYFWYRRNFLELLAQAKAQIFNCSEAGTLYGPQINCIKLEDFLDNSFHG